MGIFSKKDIADIKELDNPYAKALKYSKFLTGSKEVILPKFRIGDKVVSPETENQVFAISVVSAILMREKIWYLLQGLNEAGDIYEESELRKPTEEELFLYFA